MHELPRIFIPFMTALLQVVTAALSIGLLPALWVIASRRHYGLLVRWGIVAVICIVAATYGLPKAHVAWKTYVTAKGFKTVAMIMGYVAGALLVPMLIWDPRNWALRRLRHERPQGEQGEGERRKRRKRISVD